MRSLCQCGRDIDFFDRCIHERTVAEGFEALIQRDGCQAAAVAECIVTDCFHGSRNVDSGQAAVVECVFADGCHGIRNGDCGETCAVSKQIIKDFRGAGSKGDVIELFAALKRMARFF